MFTKEYRGAFIHGYFDKDECRVTFLKDGRFRNRTFHSYRAAQIAITKALKV